MKVKSLDEVFSIFTSDKPQENIFYNLKSQKVSADIFIVKVCVPIARHIVTLTSVAN